ncbi:thioredoxin fold domain-containing protein [Cupriavidus necator]|uniref:thioredoxin fold domain-containing protein n=1 Tax=Cupriavidus necator TaxID=106590 RepID=UPI0005B2FFC4|nr:thioredoxin fold domain-containing protein [Cupriavidus necator]
MDHNQASNTVEVSRLPAAEPGSAVIISISAVIAGGGAATADLPAESFANGFAVSIEETPDLLENKRRHTINLTLMAPLSMNALKLYAPTRETALEIQRELSKKVHAALYETRAAAVPPVRPAPSLPPAEPLHSISRSLRRKRLTYGGLVAGGVLTAALVFAMGHRGNAQQQDERAPQPDTGLAATLASPGFPQPLAQSTPLAPSGPDKDMDVTGNQLNDVDLGNLRTMGEKVGIQLRGGGFPFYVLADPACAACRALEPIWTQVPARYKPIIIPVGFQTGGEALAVNIQCSKDPVSAWKKALEGDEPPTPKGEVCKDGTTKVNAGNLFFHYLRLTGTPTIIAPNGVIATGGDTAETLSVFLKQNEVRK